MSAARRRAIIVVLLACGAAFSLSCSDDPAASDGGVTSDQASGPPALLISEFMANPGMVGDTEGEYLELYNPTSSPIDLQGWSIKDEWKEEHTIGAQLVVNPGAYVVLAANDDPAQNGGIQVAYRYDGFTLGNTGDQILLVDPDGRQVDRVVYTAPWGIFTGISNALKDMALDNGDAESWCPSKDPWEGSAGDRGSPGAPNSCGPAPVLDGGTGGDGLPYMENSISFNESLCANLTSGVKKITLRNNHWTWIQQGEWVKLVCSTSKTTFKAQITLLRHTTWGGITEQEYNDDGFSSQAQMLQVMQTYYPGITLDGPATVIRWDEAELLP